jgi:hypothetical protein
MPRLHADCIHYVASFCQNPSRWYSVHGMHLKHTPSFERIAVMFHRRLFSHVLADIPRASLEWYVPNVKENSFWPKSSNMANLVITPVRADQQVPASHREGIKDNEDLVLVEYEARGLFLADNVSANGVEGAKCMCVVAYHKNI